MNRWHLSWNLMRRQKQPCEYLRWEPSGQKEQQTECQSRTEFAASQNPLEVQAEGARGEGKEMWGQRKGGQAIRSLDISVESRFSLCRQFSPPDSRTHVLLITCAVILGTSLGHPTNTCRALTEHLHWMLGCSPDRVLSDWLAQWLLTSDPQSLKNQRN